MSPAELLEGQVLQGNIGKWQVQQRVVRKPTATGGFFSTGYLAQHEDGRLGFLKAMDYAQAFRHPDTLTVLSALTSAYLFERNVCEKCSNHHLRRVVHAIDCFTVQADSANPFGKVECLVFERAEGDIRNHLDAQQKFDSAFVLRTLHHVATGLEQLHRADIAHQDLKPSNVLVFEKKVGSKISDFGRAWSKDFRAGHDDYPIAGDLGYAPPELLYGEVAVEATKRRYGCDAYHLGSLIVFFFTRAHMNALLVNHMAPEHTWYNWGGTYSDVLPYVQAAFGRSLGAFSAATPEECRSDLTEMVSYLCQPEPAKRGHPLNGYGTAAQFGLERFISRFDALALRAEIRLMSGK